MVGKKSISLINNNNNNKIPKTESTLENESAIDLVSKHGFSATAIEKYIECPYKFFLNVVLHIQQEDEIDIYETMPANEIGNLAHHLMETFDPTISKADFIQLSEKEVDDYFIMHPSDNHQEIEKVKEEFLMMMENCYDMEMKYKEKSVLREEDLFAIHKPTQLRIHGLPDKVVEISNGLYRVVDYKTYNSLKHDPNDPATMIQGAHYAYLIEHGKNNLNQYGRKKVKVNEVVFRYLKFQKNVSSFDNGHNIDEYMKYLDEILAQIKDSLDKGEFTKTGKCKECYFRSVCGGKKDEEN